MSAEAARRPLADVAARRTLAAEQRVRAALREFEREGAAITFAAVAQRARVSRAFLYQHGELRAEIERLRAAQGAAPARPVSRERASDASLRARLRAARLISPRALLSWMTRGMHQRALAVAQRRPHPRKAGQKMTRIYLGYAPMRGEESVRRLVTRSHETQKGPESCASTASAPTTSARTASSRRT